MRAIIQSAPIFQTRYLGSRFRISLFLRPASDLHVGTSLPSVLYTATPLSIGSSEDGDPNSVLGGPTGGDTFQKLILLQFAQPVSYFSFVALSDSGDPVVADIFNSSGIDIANPLFPQGSSCAISSPGGFCQYLNVGGSYQSSTPISTLMIGSISAEADVLSIKAPEIDSSSAVSALTLLLGSLMVLISKRPKAETDGAINR